MKAKFLFCILSVTLLGCSNEELIDVNTNKTVIGFNIKPGESRVEDMTANNLKSRNFAVYGYTSTNNSETGTSFSWSQIFDGNEMYYTDNGWTYDDKQYWIYNNLYIFHAVGPLYTSDDQLTKLNWTFTKKDNENGYIEYTNDGKQDLIYCYSTLREKYTVGEGDDATDYYIGARPDEDGIYPNVALNFEHLLCRVKFRFISKDMTINSVSEIKLLGTYKSCKYTVGNSSSIGSQSGTLDLSFTAERIDDNMFETDHKFVIEKSKSAYTFNYTLNDTEKSITLPETTMTRGGSYIYIINVDENTVDVDNTTNTDDSGSSDADDSGEGGNSSDENSGNDGE